MKDEIKEILDNIKKCKDYDDEVYLIKQHGATLLLDYIINLQERIAYLERSNNRREDEIMSLRDECVDGETYKSRNEKAIELLNREYWINEHEHNDKVIDELLNILQGGDDNE